MDEIAVPISWFRQPQNQDALTVDPMYMREGETPSTNPVLQDNKTSPTVAVYLLQFYPVTQACVQPCVTTTSNQLSTPTVIPQQLPLQQPLSGASCYISQPSQTCPPVQNVGAISTEEKSTTVKLEPIRLLSEQEEIQQSNQCLATLDNVVTTTNVPLIQKWREDDSREQHFTILTTRSQENPVQVHQTNQVPQVSARSISVCSDSSSNVAYATEKFLTTIDQSTRTQLAEKPYSCNVCGKVFARAHNLKAHSQTHSGALPFPCKICRKSYSQEAYYRIHSEILSGGRPYTCEVCSKVFCNSRSFNFHVRSHSRRKVTT